VVLVGILQYHQLLLMAVAAEVDIASSESMAEVAVAVVDI
jgi:hypothetical protein